MVLAAILYVLTEVLVQECAIAFGVQNLYFEICCKYHKERALYRSHSRCELLSSAVCPYKGSLVYTTLEHIILLFH